MTSEHDYRNAVRYLQNLLNGGLMGARGNISSDDSYRSLRTAEIPNIPSLKAGRRISARIAMLTLAETATTATTRTLTMTAALSVVSGMIIVSKGREIS